MLAIAAYKSFEWNHEGVFHAEAMDKKVLKHYVEEYGAWELPLSGRPLHFVMEEVSTRKLMEVYTYEWVDGEL